MSVTPTHNRARGENNENTSIESKKVPLFLFEYYLDLFAFLFALFASLFVSVCFALLLCLLSFS
jgi:hypothetical protein